MSVIQKLGWINPIPELFIGGAWEKGNDKRAMVDIKKKKYYAPLDNSSSSIDIRKHEYDHLSFSEPIEDMMKKLQDRVTERERTDADYKNAVAKLPTAALPDMLKKFVMAYEDERVNYLGGLKGVSVYNCTDIPEDEEKEHLAKLRGANNIIINTMLYVSALHYKPNRVTKYIEDSLPPDVKQFVDSQVVRLRHTPDVNTLMDVAYETYMLFTGGKTKDKPECGNEGCPNHDKTHSEYKEGKPDKPEPDTKCVPKQNDDVGCGNKGIDDKLLNKVDAQYPPSKKREDIISLEGKSEDITDKEGDDVSMATVLREAKMAQLREKVNIDWAPMVGPIRVRLQAQPRKFRISTKKQPAYSGSMIRYPHRLVADKKIFGDIRRYDIGAILIDCSGSMGFAKGDVEAIIKRSSGATIALYAGGGCGLEDMLKGTAEYEIYKKSMAEVRHSRGILDIDENYTDIGFLVVVAQDGKIAKVDYDNLRVCIGLANYVDGPALQWLSKQRGRKFWVSDGGVTGHGEWRSDKLDLQCYEIKKKFRITQLYSLKQMREMLEAGHLRKYKDSNPLGITFDSPIRIASSFKVEK